MIGARAPASGAHTFGRFDMPTLAIGLDIAKNVFQVHGVDRSGAPVLQRKLRWYAMEEMRPQQVNDNSYLPQIAGRISA